MFSQAMAEKKAQMDKEILGDCCGNVVGIFEANKVCDSM